MIIHRQVNQKSGIITRVGRVQEDICTAIEADLAFIHFEDNIMTFEIAHNMHTLVKTVDSSLEIRDAGGRKIITPRA